MLRRSGWTNRKTPLKRTPLARSTLRSSALSRRTPLKPRSDKTQKLYDEERIPLVRRLLVERPLCEACPLFAELDGKTAYVRRKSRDLHEVKTRGRGGSIVDEDNILCVCGPCHTRITRDRDGEATRLALLRHSWEDAGASPHEAEPGTG